MRLAQFSPLHLGATLLAGIAASAALGGNPIEAQPRAGEPLRGLTAAELELFELGKARFSATLTVEQGLGPIFNKAGCFSCHAEPLGGWGAITVTRFGYENKGEFDPLEQLGGTLHQASAITPECAEFIPFEEANVLALRVTNSSLAFGLVEAIPDEAIVANADPDDLDGDGISGRVHWVQPLEDPKGPLRAGRFGWKAQVATVLTFSGDAARNEMGLTNRLEPTEAAPNGNYELLAQCDLVADPEDGPDEGGFDFIDRVTHFQRYLGPPPQTPRSGMTGELVFNAIGCAKCHTPEFTTANDATIEVAIRGKTVRPYSDFLLHDMGLLADGIPQGEASGGEFRTPTLWNLRTRNAMLHDGSAAGGSFEDRVTDAILAHGPFGEGASAAAAFSNLSAKEQGQLIAFLDSLGRLEFDLDGNSHVDFFDFLLIRECAGRVFDADDACAIADVDQNGVVDGIDFDLFETVYEGAIEDCDRNGVWDLKDIFLGNAIDKDGDGVPDSCAGKPCPADFNGNGVVDSADLTLLLGGWATAGFDLSGDGITGSADLAILLGSWGTCP